MLRKDPRGICFCVHLDEHRFNHISDWHCGFMIKLCIVIRPKAGALNIRASDCR